MRWENLLHWTPEARYYTTWKSTVGAHVHKTTYGSLIDMARPVRYAFDAGKSIAWASGRGLGPGNLDFFGPQMALAGQLDVNY